MRNSYSLLDSVATTAQKIADEFGVRVVRDEQLRFSDAHTEDLATHVKRATIRFSRKGARIPSSLWLPWIETRPDDDTYTMPRGKIFIPRIVVAHLEDFTDEDARADFFVNRDGMREGMKKIYPWIDEKSIGSVYYLDDVLTN
ncbi:TPA: hypothetical protein HA251_01675 [Candidatus Woesearchaeota archaeon]|nr:hypothetical protein [Candidatus Woesearchaeota archaeon]